MDAKWEKFDNTLSDLWGFFVPPIVNTTIILFVFQDVPRLIWDGMVSLIYQVSSNGQQSELVKQFLEILKNLKENAPFLSFLYETGFAAILSGIVTLAVLIFVLHKVTLISSRLVFGKVDLIEEELGTHPELYESFESVKKFLPNDLRYSSTHQKWEHAKAVVDSEENMGNYRNRRSNLVSQAEANKEYASYTAAYLLLSFVSFGLGLFLPAINFSVNPIFVALVTACLFILFARRYVEFCVKVADLDINVFLSLSYKNNIPDEQGEASNNRQYPDYSFLRYVDLFNGNIFSTIKSIVGGIISAARLLRMK